MLKTALLLLTLADGGAIRVTVSPAADAQDCADSREVVMQVLAAAGTTLLAAVCGKTGLTLTPFAHGTPAAAEIHRYRVELPAAGGFVLIPLAAGADCVADMLPIRRSIAPVRGRRC